MNIARLLYNNMERLISVVCLALMVIGLTYNTVCRYLFQSSLPWMEEVCAYMMIWLVYTSVSYAVRQNAHICIDSVLGLYPKKILPYVLILGSLVWTLFSIAIVVIGAMYTYSLYTKGGRAITLPLPIWVIYAIIPLGHAFVAARLIEKIVAQVKALNSRGEIEVPTGNALETVEILNPAAESEEIARLEGKQERGEP